MTDLWIVLGAFIVIKSLTIGSDFNFVNWIRYGKKYTDWYCNRPSFKDNQNG